MEVSKEVPGGGGGIISDNKVHGGDGIYNKVCGGGNGMISE